MKTVKLLAILLIFVSCDNSKIDEIISTKEFNICIGRSVERRGDYYFVQFNDSIGITFLYELDKKTKKLRIRENFKKNIIKKYKYLYNLNDPLVVERLNKESTQLIKLLNKYDLYKIDGWNKYFGIVEIFLNKNEILFYSKNGKISIDKYLKKFYKNSKGKYLNNHFYKINFQ